MVETCQAKPEKNRTALWREADGVFKVTSRSGWIVYNQEPAEVVMGVFEVRVGDERALEQRPSLGGCARGRVGGERVAGGEISGELVGVLGICGGEFDGFAQSGGVARRIVNLH